MKGASILQKYPAIFIIGVGWTVKDGYPHEMRAADYDDWVTETRSEDDGPMHDLNGDILVWNEASPRTRLHGYPCQPRHAQEAVGIDRSAGLVKAALP